MPVSTADPQWGSVDAPVTIVEISDLQCPFCARVQPTLEALKQKYGPTRLRVVWKHNPLPFHEQARPAHDVAAAVFMLGGPDAFFSFRELAFKNQHALTTSNLEEWASAAGVSRQALQSWLDSGKAARKVAEDMLLAQRIGAHGTPAFRINGVTLSGAQPLDEFVRVVDEQLSAARQLTLGGTPPREVYSQLTARNFVEPAPTPSGDEPEEPDTTVFRIPVFPDDPTRGPGDALVTIVMFSEYQCPYCKRVEPTLAELLKLYGKDLRLVWKDNPLPFHPRAVPAAKLTRFVFQTKGNDAFWKAHDALFESHPKLEESDLEALAKRQGLAWAPLEKLLASDKLGAKIEESLQLADDFQARGTPHFFVNGRRLAGAQPLEAFRKLIDEELGKARSLVEGGVSRSRVYAALMKTAQDAPAPEQKQAVVPPGAASRGNAKAAVVIQEFSDFQCPFCKRVQPTLAELEKEFKGSVRIVWRHLPLPFHKQAQLAAEASEEVLAQKGSVGFWAYHDALLDAQADPAGLSRDNLVALAVRLGVDRARFDAALDSRAHQAKVNADLAQANQIGINGTPAFLINDYYLSGAHPAAAFRRLIKRALKDKRKP